ncbi:hypothetical protein [Haliangium sp.]|uniref:hypothetical protein n=1 Tax=Haliangium sp. TaxID=2663208 RepID=UPI003D0D42DF
MSESSSGELVITESVVTITRDDVEQEISRLFGSPSQSGLVIRVHGEDGTDETRSEAFRELLSSLEMYDFHGSAKEIHVAAPDVDTITAALTVLGTARLKRRVFETVLLTFGKHLVDPLGRILDTTPGGQLLANMASIRDNLTTWIGRLQLTHETQRKLTEDIRRLLSDQYLAELAEHEEKVQRPRVAELAKDILHLIGTSFDNAFRNWPSHARSIAESVARRMGTSMSLRESPLVIRERIIEGLEEFLWIETSMELTGAVQQLCRQSRYQGLTADAPPELERELYHRFAQACWDIIAENS